MNWYKTAQNPLEETSKEFLDRHFTGHIPSWSYEEHPTREDFSWLGDRSKYPILHSKQLFNGIEVEFRQTGKKDQYVRTDDNKEIVRDAQGNAEYLTDEEVVKRGLSLYDTTIVAFDSKGPIGWVGNSFGVPEVFIIEEMQKKGIGTYLLSEWMKYRPQSQHIGQMTPAGVNMTLAYHRKLVQDAIEQGKEIPEHILEEYKQDNKEAMNWYRVIKQAQLWNVWGTNFDEDNLADLLKVFYELEYKYSMVKNSNFSGVPQRQENILNKLHEELLYVCNSLLWTFKNVYEDWLEQHALLDPNAWANNRVSHISELDYMQGTGNYSELVEHLLYTYFDNKMLSSDPKQNNYNAPMSLDYKLSLLLQEVNEDLDSFPQFMQLIQSITNDIKAGLTDDLELYGLEELSDQEGQPFKTEAQAEKHIANYTMDITDLYIDSFTQSLNASDNAEGIVTELYEKLVFPRWYAFWKKKGIDQTRARIEAVYAKLVSPPETIEQMIILIHEALSTAHQTGSMLDYIVEYTQSDDVDKDFLDQLSNSSTEHWNQDLQQNGFNTNELV